MRGGRFDVGVKLEAVAPGQSAEGNILPHGIALVKTKVEEVIIELVTLVGSRRSLVDDFQIGTIFYNFFKDLAIDEKTLRSMSIRPVGPASISTSPSARTRMFLGSLNSTV